MTKEIYEFRKIADIKRLGFIEDVLVNSIPSNGKVLDVGCGNGLISRSLGKFGFFVHGIDVSEKAIDTAKKLNLLDNVKFDVLSAEELRASSEKYDAVICSEVLEHLQDPTALVSVLYQLLKEEGKLIVTVPNGYGPRESLVTKPVLKLRKKNNGMWRSILKIKRLLGYSGTTIQSNADNLDHVQFFSRRDLDKLSGDYHFRITRFGKANFIEEIFPFSL